MPSLKTQYQELIRKGQLNPDPHQDNGLKALSALENALRAKASFLGIFKTKSPHGVYLYGPPGRGKSLLMDLFVMATHGLKVRRVHFHGFMQEIHEKIHLWNHGTNKEKNEVLGKTKSEDPVIAIVNGLKKQTDILCFDEFQVQDITDAMILGRLFEAMINQNITIVITSNRRPDDLYKDGLNRDRFLPFIALIKEKLTIVALEGPQDHRRDRIKGQATYFHPLDDTGQGASFEALWARLIDQETIKPKTLIVLGRQLTFSTTAGSVLRCDFEELCAKPLGTADYLAIAEHFSTLFLDKLPILNPEKRNEAKRFVHLIDALYEAKTIIIVRADAAPEGLYPSGDGSFEFERTVSRLKEMQSADYRFKAKSL
jgi:cell division protein ZapE